MSQENVDTCEMSAGLGVSRPNREPNHDAILQTYSLELMKTIDEMRYKRDVLHREIKKDMAEKSKLEEDLKKLTDQLMKINETICDKTVKRSRFEQCIEETAEAFQNLVVNSDNLAKFVKKVTATIAPELASMKQKEAATATRKDEKRKKGKRSESLKRQT